MGGERDGLYPTQERKATKNCPPGTYSYVYQVLVPGNSFQYRYVRECLVYRDEMFALVFACLSTTEVAEETNLHLLLVINTRISRVSCDL